MSLDQDQGYNIIARRVSIFHEIHAADRLLDGVLTSDGVGR